MSDPGFNPDFCRRAVALVLLAALAPAGPAGGGVLPEDRADALYHYYDGGGVEIDGPSLLVRKSVGQKVSLSASYYVDSISSASIDVVTTGASPDGYSEERTQWGFGADYLRGDTILSFGASTSSEDDYEADTLNFGISQEVFGGLTTITLGYGSGDDDVSRRGDDVFAGKVDRKSYRLGVSQILTRNLILALSFEGIADEGYLNNPYRRVRYLDPNEPQGYGLQPEIYPESRTSSAAAIRARYHLPYRAAVSAEYRFFTDNWGIDAHTLEAGYIHPLNAQWLVEVRYRYYTQQSADFFSDLFPFENAQNFLARDKELSSFQSHGPHLGVSYTWLDRGGERPLKSTVNLFMDYYAFSYDDFRDLRAGGVPGTEPAYDFNATVLQFFVSLWF